MGDFKISTVESIFINTDEPLRIKLLETIYILKIYKNQLSPLYDEVIKNIAKKNCTCFIILHQNTVRKQTFILYNQT